MLPTRVMGMMLDLPLSAAQLGIWYALQADVSPASYNIGEYVKISGAIDPELFDTALRQVVIETEALRVRFDEHRNVPRQVIAPLGDWSMTYQDLSSEVDPTLAADCWMRDDIARPIDFRQGPFFAFALFKIEREQYLWYARYHHLVMDGYGGSLIAHRVAEVYSALVTGSSVSGNHFGSLAALVEEDAAYRVSGHFSVDRQFWMDSLSDCPEPPRLSLRKPAQPEQFLSESISIPHHLVMQLQDVASEMEMTFPQLVTLSAGIFVHRLTNAEDVVLGQLMTARVTPTSRRTPAMVTNLVPLRLEIRPDMPVEDLALQVRRKVRMGMRHQRYRIADIRRDLRRVSRPILRQTVSVRPFDHDLRFAGGPGATYPVSNGPVDDLNIHVVRHRSEDHAWRVEFDANAALYDRDLLRLIQRRFLRLLAAVKSPEGLVGRLDILPCGERCQILGGWNVAKSDYPRDRYVHELFEQQAQRTPDRLAVLFEQQRLTYRELSEQSDWLAYHLRRRGVGPGALVGLYLERSLEMIIGLLGILKAGGVYIPLDPSYPPDRLRFILSDAQPAVLLTQQTLQNQLQFDGGDEICIDALSNEPVGGKHAPLSRKREANECAYVLYTSGSTGQPKGVQVPHRALVNFLTAMKREPGITPADKLLAVTSLSFDIAGLELFLPLIVGAQVTIAPSDVAADGFRLAALMTKCEVTIMQATPATWRLLLAAGWNGSEHLKILCGGEAWPSELAKQLQPRCASLWNMYGPTETTIWSSAERVNGDGEVLIGPPVANTTFYVLDTSGQLVPIGVAGELYIGGDGVTCGYLNRPELTQERFVVDSFSGRPAARMYKTGDLVRLLPDGRLEFLGRLDHQVKIRGYRIELGEIESVLRLHPKVQDSVVVAHDQGNGEKQLVAYVIAPGPERVSAGVLRDLLRQKLAPYMIPTAFVPLDAFPLTPNGKIDRKALPLPNDENRRNITDTYVAPRTPLEELLVRHWRDCLQLEKVGVHDNFFDIGGDSLAMVRLSLEIERATGQTFPLPWIYDAPTVADMADILGGNRSASGYSPLVLLRAGSGVLPVFIVHPVGGSTMQLIPIAKSFPGQEPIYAIQARGLDGADAPYDRVEAMAECYSRAIVEVQPHGPYFLAGMCFGGLVAMEIARRLSARGERIGLLAFLDTYPHPRYWPLYMSVNYFVIRRIKEFLQALATLSRADVPRYIAARTRDMLRKLSRLGTGTQPPVRAPESAPPAIRAVFDAGIAALMNYQPRYYPGRLSYLMCGYHAYLPHGPTCVWARLVQQLDVESAPVMMRPEYVANWLFNRVRSAAYQDVDVGSAEAAHRN